MMCKLTLVSDECCCCVDRERGAKLIGLASLLLFGLLLLWPVVRIVEDVNHAVLANDGSDKNWPDQNQVLNLVDNLQLWAAARTTAWLILPVATVGVVGVLVNLGLLVAIATKNTCLFLPWLLFNICFGLLLFLVPVATLWEQYRFHLDEPYAFLTRGIIPISMGLLTLYCWLVVLHLMQQLSEEPEEDVESQQQVRPGAPITLNLHYGNQGVGPAPIIKEEE